MEAAKKETQKETLAREFAAGNPEATPEQIYLEGFNKALLLASQNVRITVTDEFTKKVTETFGPDQQWDFADEVYQIDIDSILQTGSEIVEPDQPTQ